MVIDKFKTWITTFRISNKWTKIYNKILEELKNNEQSLELLNKNISMILKHSKNKIKK